MFGIVFCWLMGVAGATTWERTLERVVPSVVMIRSYAPRSFDGQGAGSSFATGFVVDAERGIILSNRHVVRVGPVVAEAILQNDEEIELTPIYRDPVHDFGFYQYDPGAVRFQEMSALALRPDLARQGSEIRLVGSDAGEKVSILGGTLADLDRSAPAYGRGRYNDFNTFYIQAASSSSGGSSGSPVVDIKGHVVALNAGSKRTAASSFFLPLERVKRALDLIRAGESVTRGTVHATFVHRTFDEAKRLGLSDRAEQQMRADGTGVLVVERTMTAGAADGLLEPGDIVTRVGGSTILDFVSLESIVDERVGESIVFDVERGGQPLSINVPVADLHASSPSEYIEFGNGVVHPFSYQLARHYSLPAEGMYVSQSGYILGTEVPAGLVITTVNGVPVPTLDAFEQALSSVADRADFTVTAVSPSRPNQPVSVGLTMDRTWHPVQRCTRDDATRFWPCVGLDGPERADSVSKPAPTPLPAGSRLARRLAESMVTVSFSIPFRTDGVYGNSFSGVGLVVDAEKGLVLVDRDTVPVGLGDASVVFSETTEVPAAVYALHPTHNLALVQYDPASIPDLAVESIAFDGRTLERGDKAKLVGMTIYDRYESEDVLVSNVGGLSMATPVVPMFQQRNLDLVQLGNRNRPFVGGVVTDRRGRPSAFWSSIPDPSSEDGDNWWRGIPGDVVNSFLNDPSGAESMGIEWGVESVLAAQRRGLDGDWIRRAAEQSDEAPHILEVRRITKGGSADGLVRPGDLLLSIDGRIVTRLTEAGAASGSVEMRLLRNGTVQTVTLTGQQLSSDPIRRLVLWGGASFQTPHLALAQQRGQDQEGVYVAYWWRGSPAGRFGLRPMRRVVAVDGAPTPDLDAFVEAVRNKRSGDAIRLVTLDLRGVRRMITLEADTHYWPLMELRRTEDGWTRRAIDATGGG
ncbi:MAG: trypsin-like peptidase domain-containing protein [Myxococcota bacterium]|nr:trypsin-like peptidase domain-containing protein [Myxococcota bacterium]